MVLQELTYMQRMTSKTSQLPVMSNKQYKTSPSMAQLQSMSSEELSHLSNFSITHEGVGMIEWDGPVDITNLVLDQIVQIVWKEVSVFGNRSPPVGYKLNRPAKVTMFDIYHNDKTMTVNSFIDSLKSFCLSNDATFLSYDSVNRSFVFGVKHFSKYSLLDLEDEEEAAIVSSIPASAAIGSPSAAAIHSSAHYTPIPGFNQIKQLQLTSFPQEKLNQQEEKVSMEVPSQQPSVKVAPTVERPLQTFEISNPRISRRRHQIGLQSNGITNKRDARSMIFQSVMTSNPLTIDVLSKKPKMVASPPGELPVEASSEKLDVDWERGIVLDNDFESELKQVYSHLNRLTTTQDLLEKQRAKEAYEYCLSQPLETANSPSLQLLRSVKLNYCSQRGISPAMMDYSRVSGLGKPIHSQRQKKMSNHLLAMGRSFRVSFGCDGNLIRLSTDTSCRSVGLVVIEKVTPISWLSNHSEGIQSNQIVDSMATALDAIYQSSHIAAASEEEIPQWRTPLYDTISPERHTTFMTALERVLESYGGYHCSSSHPLWFHCKFLELLHSLIDQEGRVGDYDDQALLAIGEEPQSSASQFERRTVSLRQWFESLSDIDSAAEDLTSYERIFHLLTSFKLSEAIQTAEEAGHYRLAMLLTQLGGDVTVVHLVRYQLDFWKSMNVLETIPKIVQCIYRLMAGDLFANDVWEDSVMMDMNWLRTIGSLYHYYHEDGSDIPPLALSLLCYEEACLSDDTIPSPLFPWQSSDTPRLAGLETNGLYSLLKLLFDVSRYQQEANDSSATTEALLQKILDPRGYGEDRLDYHLSYQLCWVLTGLGYLPVDSAVTAVVRQHYLSELIVLGQWKWALLIALQIPDDLNRDTTVRGILSRHCNDYQGGLYHWTEDATAIENQLIGQYNLPKELLYEVSAWRDQSRHQINSAVHYYTLCGQYNTAKSLLIKSIIPRAFLKTPNQMEKVFDRLFDIDTLCRQREEGNEAMTEKYLEYEYDVYLSYHQLRKKISSVKMIDSPALSLDTAIEFGEETVRILGAMKRVYELKGVKRPSERVLYAKMDDCVWEALMMDISSYLIHTLLKLTSALTDQGLPMVAGWRQVLLEMIDILPVQHDLRYIVKRKLSLGKGSVATTATAATAMETH